MAQSVLANTDSSWMNLFQVCLVSASKEPQVSESAQERTSTSFCLFPSHGSPLLSSDGTALRNEKWQKKSLCYKVLPSH